MRFFNIDQHISVIADLKFIFKRLGHTIDDICMSGHAFVMRRRTESIPKLNGDNWCGMVDGSYWDWFYDEYKNKLKDYDGFICCYPPLYAMLYKKFNKPIIVDIPIRYDHGVHFNPVNLHLFNEYLKQENVFLVANNAFDKHYCENFIDKKVEHIPSLCEYTGAFYSGKRSEYLYFSSYKRPEIEGFAVKKEQALPAGFTWNQRADYKGAIHFPYQISTMSIFELYTEGVPLFFPTQRFMLELYQQKQVLDHYCQCKLFNNPPQSFISGNNHYDPNNYTNIDSVAYWLKYADYYDKELMPDIQYFDSFKDLSEKIKTVDLKAVSRSMGITNVLRTQKVYSAWEQVLNRIQGIL